MVNKNTVLLMSLLASGCNVASASSQTGIKKSTSYNYLKRLEAASLTPAVAMTMTEPALRQVLTVDRSANYGYCQPDYEDVYVRNNHRSELHESRMTLWKEYCRSVPKGARALSYAGFCKVGPPIA